VRRHLAPLLLLGLAGVPGAGELAAAPTQTPHAPQEQPSQVDTTEFVNALLGGLMGGPIDGATLQKEVEDAGGVPFKHEVPISFLKRSELGPFLTGLFDQEYPPALARADERLLAAFDLLPAGTDLRQLRERVLEASIAGFYDDRPEQRRLYAVSDDHELTPMNQIVLAHELRHALQDQYADLHAQVTATECDFDDRRLAILSLYEGDATLVMERFLRARLGPLGALAANADGAGDAGAAALGAPELFDLPGLPTVLRDQLVQPYVAGLGLARALWQKGGPTALREAWGNPPDSTEQVLHPELFFRREAPRVVSPRTARPVGASLLSEGVLGELLLRTLLEQPRAQAAAGWGGDGWRLWDVRGRTLLAWRSEWDTLPGAVTFHDALRERFAQHLGPPRTQDGWETFEGQGRWVGLRRVDDAVELVGADDARLFADALQPRTGVSNEAGPAAGEPRLDIGAGNATVPKDSVSEETAHNPNRGGLMATSTPPGNPTKPTNLGMAPNVAGLLCYVPCCIGLVFSVVAVIVEKQSRFVRFHALQSLLLHGVFIVLAIAVQILNAVLAVTGLGILGVLIGLLGLLVGLGFLGITIFLMVKANAGEELELPVIGPMARQWV
jgi:uncharacterized membrane protein